MCYFNVGRARVIRFLFYLDRDTAISVSTEMVEHLKIPDQNVNFIAELIDLLLINLFPDWKPCVDIAHLSSQSCKGTHTGQKDLDSTEQNQPSKDSVQNNSEEICHSMTKSVASNNHYHSDVDECSSHVNKDHGNTINLDDLSCETSQASITSDISEKKLSHVSFSSVGSAVSGGTECSFVSTTEDHLKDKTSKLGCHDTLNYPQHSSNVPSLYNGDELKIEIDKIEQNYLVIVKEASKIRSQAITEIITRLTQKNIQ